MGDNFYRLHEALEMKPARWRNAKAHAKFDSKSMAFFDWQQHAPFQTRPMVIGLCVECNNCARWEPVEPCNPHEIERQMERKGWREQSSGENICPKCARDN